MGRVVVGCGGTEMRCQHMDVSFNRVTPNKMGVLVYFPSSS